MLVAVVVVAGVIALLYTNGGNQGNSTVTAPQFPGQPCGCHRLERHRRHRPQPGSQFDRDQAKRRARSLSGLNNMMLTLCAQAQKLDSTNSTLLLSINSLYPKNTPTPYGSVSFCGGVAP